MALNDINQMFSIVDPASGKPTDYLMRLLRDRGITSDDLVTQVAELNTTVTTLSEAVDALDGTVFTAGVGLAGGGILGADDPIVFDINAGLNDLSDVDTTTVPPTDGQALIYVAADSEWVPGDVASGGGGGGSSTQIKTLIGTLDYGTTASSSNDFDISDYDDVIIEFDGLTIPAGEYGFRLSNDGGSTFVSGASDYVVTAFLQSSISETNVGRSFCRIGFGSATNMQGSFFLRNLKQSGVKPTWTGDSNRIVGGVGHGWGFLNQTSGPYNSLRILNTSGNNVTAGTLRVYGIKSIPFGVGADWELIKEYDHSVDGTVANIDITESDLGDFDELQIVGILETASSGNISVRASTDNLSTIIAGSNYNLVFEGNSGVSSTTSSVLSFTGSDTTADKVMALVIRRGKGVLYGWSELADRELVEARCLIGSNADNTNSLRIFSTVGGNITGGAIKVFKRSIGAASSGGGNFAIFEDVKGPTTDGGSAVSSAWTARELNTEQHNTLAGVSLASNRITLPAGTYKVEAVSTFYRTDRTGIRLRDITNSATLIVGMQGLSDNSTDGDAIYPNLLGVITLAGSADLELQYYCDRAQAGNGLGLYSLGGEDNVFSRVTVTQL